MRNRFNLSFIFAATVVILIGCSGKPDPALEKARQDSIRVADSIAAEEKALAAAEQARLDSIKEAESLKPTCFIKRASSTTYEFRDSREITANLKKLGFKKKQYNKTDWLEGYCENETSCEEYYKETTIFSRMHDGEETKISEVLYGVEWGGVGSDEFYFTISFPNEEAKKDFIEKVLKMNCVSQKGSKIIIGAGEDYETLYISDSEPLQVNLYSDYGLKFHKYRH